MAQFDLVVVGGGLGGVAAVLAAARLGRPSVLARR
jgi:succinate dehydrogenase/fumarate reductase flavoprotein subunit